MIAQPVVRLDFDFTRKLPCKEVRWRLSAREKENERYAICEAGPLSGFGESLIATTTVGNAPLLAISYIVTFVL